MYRNSQSGFSLVTLLVTVAISSILGLAFFKQQAGLSRGYGSLTASGGFQSLMQEVRMLSDMRGQCKLTFVDTAGNPARFNPNSVPTPAVKVFLKSLGSGRRTLASLATGYRGFKLTSISLTESDSSVRQTLSGRTTYLVRLNLNARKVAVLGTPNLGDGVPLLVTTDTDPTNAIPDHTILSCAPSSGSTGIKVCGPHDLVEFDRATQTVICHKPKVTLHTCTVQKNTPCSPGGSHSGKGCITHTDGAQIWNTYGCVVQCPAGSFLMGGAVEHGCMGSQGGSWSDSPNFDTNTYACWASLDESKTPICDPAIKCKAQCATPQ